ncbi:MAG: hypothetical protein J2P45_03480 [Candidatus Dormibacteraeota bacterium]|nr:hypothetical protein [Candidatus Dormibacteraeota bacterium]
MAIIFALFYLWGALTPGYLASDVILGALFVLWVGEHAIGLTRWSRRADRLVEILSSTCEAVVQRG